MLIAARAIRSATGFVYVRGEYVEPWRRFAAAVREAYEARYLGDGFDIVVHRGAGAYICGEETAHLVPRGQEGLAEAQAAVPGDQGRVRRAHHREQRRDDLPGAAHHQPRRRVVRRGSAPRTQGGTRMYSVSGRVARPAVYETSVSITLRQLIYDLAGGVTGTAS